MIEVFNEQKMSKGGSKMKKEWITPHLEALEISMTMKWHDDGGGGHDGDDPEDCDPLDS